MKINICHRKELSKVKPYKPGKPIEEVQRELKLKNVYKMASNEIPFPPLYLRKTLLKELNKINRYPESGCFYLRQHIAKIFDVDSGMIVFGNGSDDIIGMALRAFVGLKDEVIVAFPTFLIYEIQANIQGAKIIRVPLKDLRYDLTAMAHAITPKTKVVFIANPDNPTGSYVNHAAIAEFFKKIPSNVLVFLDEAYFDFAPKDFPRSLKFLKSRGNIIIARTFSKAYGLAGLRIGFAITNKEIALILEKIREPFNVNRFAQVCAVEALKNKTRLKKVITHTLAQKKYLYREFKKIGINFRNSAANFILVNHNADTADLNAYLLKNGIIIRELREWGLSNFYRVTIGLHEENKKFISCLKQYISEQTKIKGV